jgi:hypothetical protein
MVELLMANLPHNWMWTLDGKSVSGSSRDELEKEVRTYLESLVPAQKLLSECEEYKNVTTQGETVVYRVGRDVYRSVDNMWVGYAENVQAKPVEVNRE